MDTFSGLPAHPLFVHLPVVAIPLAAIGAVLLAMRPGWCRAYGPVVLALAALGAVGGVLAASSGEALEESERIRDLGDHGELGEMARNLGLLLFIAVAAMVVLDRLRTHPRVAALPRATHRLTAAACALVAIGAVAAVVAAGHSGASRVWEEDHQSHPPVAVTTPR